MMEARFRVEPSQEKGKYDVEIYFDDNGIQAQGTLGVEEKDLDSVIDNFKSEKNCRMIQILPDGEERII